MLNTETRSATPNPDPQQPQPLQSAGATGDRVRIDSERLLQGGRELFIAHAGEEYRLRLTRNDKLILTK